MSATPILLFGLEQFEDRGLLGVVGLGRVAGSRADATVRLADQLAGSERFVRRVAPQLAAHDGVGLLGERFGDPVGERLDQDRRVVVVARLEPLGDRDLLRPGGDHERSDVVGDAGVGRGDEVGDRQVRLAVAALAAVGADRASGDRWSGSTMSSPSRWAGQKPTTARGANHCSSTIWSSMRRASSNSGAAASPSSASVRIAG